MATRLIVPEEPVRPATVGISQLEFAAGVTDLDDKPAVILVCARRQGAAFRPGLAKPDQDAGYARLRRMQ